MAAFIPHNLTLFPGSMFNYLKDIGTKMNCVFELVEDNAITSEDTAVAKFLKSLCPLLELGAAGRDTTPNPTF